MADRKLADHHRQRRRARTEHGIVAMAAAAPTRSRQAHCWKIPTASRGIVARVRRKSKGPRIYHLYRRPVHLHQCHHPPSAWPPKIEAFRYRTQMTPPEDVSELDKHIVGQDRPSVPWRSRGCATAGGARRWRAAAQRDHPRTSSRSAPTGVGKTEIARRRAPGPPFIKIEATRFTEVGYVGRRVDHPSIRDLMEIAVKGRRELLMKSVRDRAGQRRGPRARRLLPPARPVGLNNRCPAGAGFVHAAEIPQSCARANSTTRRSRSRSPRPRCRPRSSPRRAWRNSPSRSRACSEPRRRQEEPQAEDRGHEAARRRGGARLIGDEEVARGRARGRAERHRLLDEDRQDRTRAAHCRARMSPVRACSATCCRWSKGTRSPTKYGMVKTDHILFIASGAFPPCPSPRI